VLAVAVLVGLALAPSATAQPAAEGLRISARGHGEVPFPPDGALVTLGVGAEAESAAGALAALTAAQGRLAEALGPARTYSLTLPVGRPVLATVTGAGPEGGYRATSRLRLDVADPEAVGPLLTAALAAGATNEGVRYTVADAGRYRQRALALAVADAAAEGRALAAALGGRVVRLVEASTLASPAPVPGDTTMAADVELTLEVAGAELPTPPTPSATPRATATRRPPASPTGPTAELTGTVSAPAATTARPAGPLTVAPAASTARATGGATFTASPTAGATGAAAAGVGLPFVPVAQAENGRYRSTRARAFVVTSPADWRRMVAPLLPNGVQVDADYAREAVVVVFLGERPAPGYGLKVRDIQTEDGLLVVHVATTTPAAPDRAAGPTSPFQIVTVRRADLPAGTVGPVQAEVRP
jgi:uncharacterized protein YggE